MLRCFLKTTLYRWNEWHVLGSDTETMVRASGVAKTRRGSQVQGFGGEAAQRGSTGFKQNQVTAETGDWGFETSLTFTHGRAWNSLLLRRLIQCRWQNTHRTVRRRNVREACFTHHICQELFFLSYPYPRSGTNPHVERQSNEKLTGFDFGFYSPRIKLRSVRRCNPLYVADDTKLIIPVQVRWIEFPPSSRKVLSLGKCFIKVPTELVKVLKVFNALCP